MIEPTWLGEKQVLPNGVAFTVHRDPDRVARPLADFGHSHVTDRTAVVWVDVPVKRMRPGVVGSDAAWWEAPDSDRELVAITLDEAAVEAGWAIEFISASKYTLKAALLRREQPVFPE